MFYYIDNYNLRTNLVGFVPILADCLEEAQIFMKCLGKKNQKVFSSYEEAKDYFIEQKILKFNQCNDRLNFIKFLIKNNQIPISILDDLSDNLTYFNSDGNYRFNFNKNSDDDLFYICEKRRGAFIKDISELEQVEFVSGLRVFRFSTLEEVFVKQNPKVVFEIINND